jgi:aryl-alcohol dehydrogenase-like predicted oxidoreductase
VSFVTEESNGMDHVFLGRTGVRTSRLAFGTMSFGGDADEAESARMFAACRDAGINHFDCADVYAGGRSEEILGGLIADCRDDVILATKAYFPTGGGVNDRGSSRYHLVRAVDASLQRLSTDRIDLYYLHRFDDATAIEETLRALDDLVRTGKVLYPAVSNFAAWQVTKALGIQAARGLRPLVAMQPMYNLLKRQAESEILPMARSERLAVFPYSPLAGGLLSGKYGPDTRPESGRGVDNLMYATRYGDPSNFEIAGAFTALAAELGHHPVTLAVAWVAAHPAVTAPLLGARDLEQLQPALAALEIDMTDELRDRVSALSRAPAPATDRNEEGSAHTYGSR